MKVALLAAVILLTACEDRRSFEERYQDTSKQIEAKERALSQDLSDNMVAEPTAAGAKGN